MTEFQYNSAHEAYFPTAKTSGPANAVLLCLIRRNSNFTIEVASNGIIHVLLSDLVKTDLSLQKLREEDTLADADTHTHTNTHARTQLSL